MKRKGFKYTKGATMPCPKCGHDTCETKAMAMSSKFSLYGSFLSEPNIQFGEFVVSCVLAMHCLISASQPRLSETE